MSDTWFHKNWSYRRKIRIHRSGNVITVNVGEEESSAFNRVISTIKPTVTSLISITSTIKPTVSNNRILSTIKPTVTSLVNIKSTVKPIVSTFDAETLEIMGVFQ